MKQVQAEVTDAVVRVIPPATVSFLNLSNTFLSSAVYALTFVYILCQIVVLFPKVIKVFRRCK